MSDLERTLRAIHSNWSAQKVAIRPGASDEAIRAFEHSRHVRLPAEVQRFYMYMDGMERGSMDEDLNFFWPLSEIDTVPAKLCAFRGIPDYSQIEALLPKAATYFAFADHSIWVSVVAVQLDGDASNPAPVIGICGSDWWQVADSFAEFLHLYAADPLSILKSR